MTISNALVPLKLNNNKVTASIGKGCTHWLVDPKANPIPNNTETELSKPIEQIMLIGVPSSMRGPFMVEGEATIPEGALVTISGPFEGRFDPDAHPLVRQPQTLHIQSRQPGDSGVARDQEVDANLRLNPYLALNPTTLEHFEQAWTSMATEAADRKDAIDGELASIRFARRVKSLDLKPQPGEDSDRDSDDENNNNNNGDWRRRMEHDSDMDSD